MDKLIHPDVNFIFPVAPTTKINKEIISDKFIESWRSSVIESPYLTVEDWFEIMDLKINSLTYLKMRLEIW